MNKEQYLIWPESEWGPKLKTDVEVKREKIKSKLVEKIIVPSKEIIQYFKPLNKKNLISFFEENNFEKNTNKGVPQMLLTTLSNYFEKDQEFLRVSDLIIFYKSLENISLDVEKNVVKKFSKANNLRFGGSQYTFMERYFNNLD